MVSTSNTDEIAQHRMQTYPGSCSGLMDRIRIGRLDIHWSSSSISEQILGDYGSLAKHPARSTGDIYTGTHLTISTYFLRKALEWHLRIEIF